MYSNSYAMLATQLNAMVAKKELNEMCIIKVNKLQCNNMQGKMVIIVLDAEVLRPGSEVGQKIGNPIAINADGSVDENYQKAVRPAGKRTRDDQVSKKPLQEQTGMYCSGSYVGCILNLDGYSNVRFFVDLTY